MLIKFLDFESWRLFEVGAYSRFGAYSNKYGMCGGLFGYCAKLCRMNDPEKY